ncbi:hypothetical protein [Salibacterium sp. K-3]
MEQSIREKGCGSQMMYGRRNNIIIALLAVVGLFALLGDDLKTIAAVLTAVLLFYAGAQLLRRPESGVTVVTGLVLLVIGSLVLAGSFPVSLGAVVFVLAAGLLWIRRREKRGRSSE